MSFEEAQLSLQLMAEVGHGSPGRQSAYARRAREDDAFDSLKVAVG